MTPAASPGSQRSPEGAASSWEHVSAESGGEEAAGGGPWRALARDEGLLNRLAENAPRVPDSAAGRLCAGGGGNRSPLHVLCLVPGSAGLGAAVRVSSLARSVSDCA